jgi:aryl-alcohol dehydrogenase-like predicted oxidoreductase
MRQRYLGGTGLLVSELGLGAMTFGRETDEAASGAILDRYVEAGGTFIDTADVYGDGTSEEIVGRWLKGKRRDDLVVATKARYRTGPGRNDSGLSRKHLVAALDASLRRLGTDHVDLYQVHAWDHATPLEETLGTLDGLVRAGKVRYLGASNLTGWQLQKSVDLSRSRGWEPFRSLQPLYNLLDREAEWELLPVCRAEGLGVVPWSPLRGGWLTGKVRRGMTAPPADSRIHTAERLGWSEAWSAYQGERTWRVLDALLAAAGEVGRTPAQVAIGWLLRQPGVTAPIIGARTLAQLDDNLAAAGSDLPGAVVERLDAVSALPLPYPHRFLVPDDDGR